MFTDSWLYRDGKAEGKAAGKAEGQAHGLIAGKCDALRLVRRKRSSDSGALPELDLINSLIVLDELLALLEARDAEEGLAAIRSALHSH
jgi:hypothetical protein